MHDVCTPIPELGQSGLVGDGQAPVEQPASTRSNPPVQTDARIVPASRCDRVWKPMMGTDPVDRSWCSVCLRSGVLHRVLHAVGIGAVVGRLEFQRDAEPVEADFQTGEQQ